MSSLSVRENAGNYSDGNQITSLLIFTEVSKLIIKGTRELSFLGERVELFIFAFTPDLHAVLCV